MPGALTYRFQVTFAGVPLLVESWETNRSRNLIVHVPARGRGAQLSDRGRVPREDTLTVRLLGDAPAVTAARDTLIALEDLDTAATFQHPIDGAWLARLSDFTERADANGPVFTMKLTEDLREQRRLEQSTREEEGSQRDVETAAAIFETRREELAAVAPETAELVVSGDGLTAPVSTWSSAPAAQVALDAEEQRGQVGTSLQALDGLLEPEAHETALALLELQASLERYRRSLKRLATTMAEIEVPTDMPLVRILSDLYGAARAGELVEDVVRTNSITNPLRVRAGTMLELPAA